MLLASCVNGASSDVRKISQTVIRFRHQNVWGSLHFDDFWDGWGFLSGEYNRSQGYAHSSGSSTSPTGVEKCLKSNVSLGWTEASGGHPMRGYLKTRHQSTAKQCGQFHLVDKSPSVKMGFDFLQFLRFLPRLKLKKLTFNFLDVRSV